MKTRAAILEKIGGPLRIAEIEVPPLKTGQLLVRIDCSGICRSQLMEVQGRRGPDRYLPHLLGHEGAGAVVDVGGKIRKVKTGDHVVLTWIKGKGLDAGGSVYKEKGKAINAGPVTTFSEYAVISENRCVPIDGVISKDLASLLGCAVPTGAGIVLNEMKAGAGDSIAVWGVGGIGLCALAGAVLAGCDPIIAIDILPDKLTMASEFGATCGVDANDRDPVQRVLELNGGVGVDFAVEAAGRATTIEQAFASVKDDGGLCVFASHPPEGERISLEPHALIRGKRIRGTWGGASNPDEDIPRFVKLHEDGRLPLQKLITHRFPLNEINGALKLLESGAPGRIVIETACGEQA